MGRPRSGLHTAAAVLLFVGAGAFLFSAMIDFAIILSAIGDGWVVKGAFFIGAAVMAAGGVFGIVGGVQRMRGRGRGLALLGAAVQFGSMFLLALPSSLGIAVGFILAPIGWLCGLAALVLLLIPDRPEDMRAAPAVVALPIQVSVVEPPRLKG